MKIMSYLIVLKTFHESFAGYDHFDGYATVKVRARNVDEASAKAVTKWNKAHSNRCWSTFWTVGA